MNRSVCWSALGARSWVVFACVGLVACSEAPSSAPIDASDERAADASSASNDASNVTDAVFQDVSSSDAVTVGADAAIADAVMSDAAIADAVMSDAAIADDVTGDVATADASRATSARLVVDAAWLTAALSRDATLQVIDVRDAASYLGGHLPRAISFEANTLSATVNGVGTEVLDGATVARMLGAAGIRSNVATVVYGAAVDTTSARLVWVLHHYGLDDVHLLDGGYPSWTAAGNAPETSVTRPTAVTYTVSAGRDLIEGPAVRANVGVAGVHLVDARAASEFAAGHIPGARNVDWTTLVMSGAFRSEAEVRASFAGVPLDAQVIVYCQSGMRGSVDWVAMRNLGYSRAVLYDGSWSDWSARGYPREP